MRSEKRRKQQIEASARWHKNNPDRIKKAQAKWYGEHREQVTERSRKYYIESREQIQERNRKYYADHREKLVERNKKYRREHPNELRVAKLLCLYGLTTTEYQILLDKTGNICPVCRQSFDGRIPCIDHNHENGVIRGLICRKCNLALGLFDDNIDILINAIEYLKIKREDKLEQLFETSAGGGK